MSKSTKNTLVTPFNNYNSYNNVNETYHLSRFLEIVSPGLAAILVFSHAR